MTTERFIFHQPIALPRPRSQRTRTIARWFGLSSSRPPSPALPIGIHELHPRPSQIVLITGPSGAGKSALLGQLTGALPARSVIDLNRLRLPRRPVVDCIDSVPIRRALKLLSRAGLAEAWTYLRTPDELSDGQRWRLRVAVALHRLRLQRDPLLICDEFCALLDRVTAAVIARMLRRTITMARARAIVATSHDDLVPALAPDVLVKCDFGATRVTRGP